MLTNLPRLLFAVVGLGSASAALTGEFMQGLLAVGLIVGGYAWIEWRIERIVKRELKAHIAAEEGQMQDLIEKVDVLLDRGF